MTRLIILKRARELIEKPSNWTRRALARDASDNSVNPEDASACSYCTMGSVERASTTSRIGAGRKERRDDALEFLREFLPKNAAGSFIRFNDDQGTTHAEILALFDRAIAEAERQEGAA